MRPIAVPLHRYQDILWAIDVGFAGETHRFLFDTGAGISMIDARLAERVGLQPHGRLTGYRMTGQRIDMPQCNNIDLTLGGLSIPHGTVGVFDLMSVLPAGFPEVPGVISLATFAELPVTLDLGRRALVLESEASLKKRVDAMTPLEIRVGRLVQGLAIEIYVAVRNGGATAWLQLDSGNTGPVLLGAHLADSWGFDPRPERGFRFALPLDLGTGDSWTTDVIVRDLIIDGNLGATFLDGRTLSLDLRGPALWIERGPV